MYEDTKGQKMSLESEIDHFQYTGLMDIQSLQSFFLSDIFV